MNGIAQATLPPRLFVLLFHSDFNLNAAWLLTVQDDVWELPVNQVLLIFLPTLLSFSLQLLLYISELGCAALPMIKLFH